MKRRGFIKTMLGLAGVAAVPASASPQYRRPRPAARRILLQQIELAGFQYYQGERLFPELRRGDALGLRRAPQNKYDPCAVEVYWGGSMLGHIPRIGNMTISQMMDRGEPVSAAIADLAMAGSPWERIQVAIYWHPA